MRTLSGRRLIELVEQRCTDPDVGRDARVVSQVLPFKVSSYVVDELVDWTAAPDDPMYRLVFPHRDMLEPEHFDAVAAAIDDPEKLRLVVSQVRAELNPHPSGQIELNVPKVNGRTVWGLQHKYQETVLVFPRQGQTCHSYCGYCFRWAQFVGESDLKLAVQGPEVTAEYLRAHPEVTDVVLTGGDPLVMRTGLLASYIDPLFDPELEHIRTIRVGTKALSFHPDRFLTDPDSDALMALFERVVAAGKQLALMIHVSHSKELSTERVRHAIRRIAATGAQLRSQAPMVKHVNDSPVAWSTMWQQQVELGVHPYYMFVERDTGSRRYFGLPLDRAWRIYRDAISGLSGLGKTARGPVMSATPGKVHLDGVVDLPCGKAFAMRFLQARDERLIGRPFFARWSPTAEWWDELEPFSEADSEFFAKHGVEALCSTSS